MLFLGDLAPQDDVWPGAILAPILCRTASSLTVVMQCLLLSLEVCHYMQEAQAYFSGHEHNLQYMHVEGQPTHYIVSGAGSLTEYPPDYWDNGGGRFQHQGSGFVACELSSSALECDYIGLDNEILYRINVPQH